MKKEELKNAIPAPVLTPDQEKIDLERLACEKEVDEVLKKYNCLLKVTPYYLVSVVNKQ